VLADRDGWRRGPERRLFWEDGHPLLGQPVTFSEDGIFFGGVVDFAPYGALGLTRREAVAILEQIEIRTRLAEVTEGGIGGPVEQPLMETTVKSTVTADLGLVVSKGLSCIAQLPAGQDVSTTEASHPVVGDFSWTVDVVMTPSIGGA
jgi:hypothetical protein